MGLLSGSNASWLEHRANNAGVMSSSLIRARHSAFYTRSLLPREAPGVPPVVPCWQPTLLGSRSGRGADVLQPPNQPAAPALPPVPSAITRAQCSHCTAAVHSHVAAAQPTAPGPHPARQQRAQPLAAARHVSQHLLAKLAKCACFSLESCCTSSTMIHDSTAGWACIHAPAGAPLV